jgi:hypothetical protein
LGGANDRTKVTPKEDTENVHAASR